ncbi:N-acetylglucosamine-6-phosphate deacetylase [Cytobacillus solani]|uniref:N-acetylglucosamine-6-phosphate deacetylase n=1 Tax=Cytobacillus solani TaxID=1637975 RepID=A0A0Q3VFG8_9BACI|nr:N-acetylglucosamine-6-phosphate deacetylase [Cytobacillus solani]KOP71242.1 N-acetylglucosamine-6-phosphate deacetylase [Bacillus sp. FJAT-21945]KQL17815.1 N-acetylglucosamine-6-phosphate deacetylase [Cytobacillus solani]USK55629.1 N-acetylglucosamine-6-phosphate deacetylase [Cytobacillus solani]
MDSHERNRLILKNIEIYTEAGVINNGFIKIDTGKIAEIGSMSELTSIEDYHEMAMLDHYTVIPGLIDVHIHGVDGSDVMDGTKEALDRMSAALPKEGTTSFLATTMTQSEEAIQHALINVAKYMETQLFTKKAEILGIHLEGPFVNKKMAGAQPIQYIIKPNVDLFKKWQQLSNGNIKLVTLAPEIDGCLELIHYLRDTDVIASIGHSLSTYEETKEAINAGVTHATHLFNQMSGLHHREPGVVGAVFLQKELKAELIADGIHTTPEIVKLAYKIIGHDRLILITDSMRAKCLKNGTYDLGGQDVTVQNGKAVLSDGTLAGSILKMGGALKNMISFTGCTLADVIQMGSANPAKQLNIFDRKGSIAVGKDADLVILDKNYDVKMTLCKGLISYDKEGLHTNENH